MLLRLQTGLAPTRKRFVNIALWVIVGLLAAVFLLTGLSKLFIPREELAKSPGERWGLDFSAGFVKSLGVLEILGAAGLTLPRLLGIASILVPLAALCLGLIMIGVVIVLFRRREYRHVLVDVTYLLLAVFVVAGHFGSESFTG
jgi:hypothetical protein